MAEIFDNPNMADFGATTEAPVEATAKKANSKQVMKQIHAIGEAAYNEASEAERESFGTKKDTLFFVGYAVLSSKKTDVKRRKCGTKQVENKNGELVTVSDYENVYTAKSVGVAFKTTEAIEVPVIDMNVTTSNVDVATVDVGSRPVAAGQTFVLTPIEALYFCSKAEYSNQFTTETAGNGYMHLNCASYSVDSQKGLPTPTFHLESGAARDMELPIDKNVGTAAEPKWTIGDDPEYARFAKYLQPKTAKRMSAPKEQKPAGYNQVIIAAAVRKLIGR
jgi:hypothetical protein